MFDVITIGSATLDVFLNCHSMISEEVNGKKEICFPYGAKVDVNSVLFETGGGGTNSATTFTRLGLHTAVIAKIGNDFPGKKVLKKLEEEDIDTSLVVKDDNDITDFSTIVWAPGKGSVVLVNRGKRRLEISNVNWETLRAKWLYICSVEGNLDIVEKATKLQMKLLWNPGKREIEQKEKVIKLLSFIRLLVLNKKEASLLLDSEDTDIQLLLGKAAKLPAQQKLITDGHNGSYYFNGKNWFHAKAFSVKRQEATGAGDAFGSAFAAGLIKELSEKDCLKLATANAASVVTAPSAKQGILKVDQVDKWMNKELEIKLYKARP